MKVSALRTILLLCLQAALPSSYAQSDVRSVSVSSLPEAIRELEDISLALRWTDTVGINVVVTTQKSFGPSDDPALDYEKAIVGRELGLRKGRRELGSRKSQPLTATISKWHLPLRFTTSWSEMIRHSYGAKLKVQE